MSYDDALAPPRAVAVNLNLNTLLAVVIDGSWTTGAASSDEVMVKAYPAKFWISSTDPPVIGYISILIKPQFELLDMN